jgi:hypothetical protein
MMLSKYEARLCPVYRGVDDCLETLGKLTYLENYQDGSRVGFSPDVQRCLASGIDAAITLVNRLAAVYRDANYLSDEVPRLKFDAETGVPELTDGWGEVSLRGEVLWFLATEAANVKQMLQRACEVPPSQ